MVLIAVKKATFVLVALLLTANISKCDRDWSSPEVVPRNGSASLLQKSKAASRYDDCGASSKNLDSQECCPTNLRYSHPRVLMDHKGCDCYCGMAQEAECWEDPTDISSENRMYTDARGANFACCPQEQALGPHRRLVSEISQCNCWCGQAAQEKESLFGPKSWTRKLALRTLASIQDVDDEEDNADATGNVAASLNAVGNFKRREGRRNTTMDAKSEAARIQASQISGTTDFLGHTPTPEESTVLRKVIDEWEEQKKKIGTAKGSGSGLQAALLPNFSEFAGPELMSLYMDKARAAMLSERDVREQADKVVDGLINRHLAFRNDELEWSDRQTSFNDLLAHAENYLQHTEPGRVEDRVNMGEALVRPLSSDPGSHWGHLETLPRPKPSVVLSPEVHSTYMYKHVNNQAQGEYRGDMSGSSLVMNLLGHTLVVDEGDATSVSIMRPSPDRDPQHIKIVWNTPDEAGHKLLLEGEMDRDGVISGQGKYVEGSDLTRTVNTVGTFSIGPKDSSKARECGPRTYQESPQRFCCDKELFRADRFFVTRPAGSCDCWCGKLP